MKTLAPITFFCCLITGQLWAQEQLPAVDATAICSHIADLAADEFQGRKTGTAAEGKTVTYLQQQFQAAGLAPGNGQSYLQEVDLAYFSTTAPAIISLQGKNGRLELRQQEDYFLASTQALEHIDIQAEQLVFAGFGIHAPEIGWDDYAGVEVKGKIVVVLADTPDQYTRDTSSWKGDPGANLYGKNFYKSNEAATRGAKGILIIFREKGPGFFSWDMLAGLYTQPNLKIRRRSPDGQLAFSGYLKRNAAERLFDAVGLQDYNFQEEALKPGFKALALELKTQFRFSNSWSDLRTHNVVGLIRGSERPDEVILYTAHWDHVGIGPAIDGDSIRNGAVDNASGTAALIEIARAYRRAPEPPKRSILFIATAAEELGLLGAVWYAAYPLFPIGKTVASLNMDAHFPYGKTTHIAGVVYGRSELDNYLEESARHQGRILVPNTEGNVTQDIFFRSDHFPLAEVGVPSEFAVGTLGVDSIAWAQKMAAYATKYHQPTDEYNTEFDCDGIAQDAQLIFRVGYRLSQNDHFPQWNADQPFQRFRAQSRRAINTLPETIDLNTLLNRHATAMGGTDAWLKLKSWIISQKRTNGTVIATAKKPDLFRLDFRLTNRTIVKSYDGKSGWLTVNGQYEAMRPGEAVEMAEEPDFYGELIFARHRGDRIELMEKEILGNRWCYRLKLIKSATDEQWYWIDAESYLILQTAEYSEDPAHDGIFYKTVFGDYRPVKGLMFPHREGLIANDGPPREWTLEKIEVNVPIPKKAFRYRPDR